MNEILDALEWMARQHCCTNSKTQSEPGLTDSGALSANADALQILDEHNRFRIVREYGRMVCGYWPEDDPEKQTAEAN